MARIPKGDYRPDLQEIETEMSQTRSKGKYRQALRGTAGTVVVVAAIAVLIATLILPVIRITGTSMQPGFQPGDIVLVYRNQEFKQGDICAFYFNNKLILKRIIGLGGDTIEIDEAGHVTVNGVTLVEDDYISEYALGQNDIEYPFQVPQGEFFVMGDNRDNTEDSRATNYGCIKQEEMMGKVFLRVWPLNSFKFYGF